MVSYQLPSCLNLANCDRPMVKPEDSAYILDMLCSILEPLAAYKQLQDSTSKQEKKNRADILESAKPEISNYITLGFNKTNESLEKQARRFYASSGASEPINAKKQDNAESTTSTGLNDISMVFVCKQDMKSALLWNHFPSLCTAATLAIPEENHLKVRLIQLPSGAHSRLATAAGLDRLSVLGLRSGSSVTAQVEKRLIEKEIGIVEVPGWMNQLKLNPTIISSLKTTAPIRPGKNQVQKKVAEKQPQKERKKPNVNHNEKAKSAEKGNAHSSKKVPMKK